MPMWGDKIRERLTVAVALCFLTTLFQNNTLIRTLSTSVNVAENISWSSMMTANSTTLQKLVRAANNGEGCQGDYRNYPIEVQDGVNELLAVAMMREPAVAVRNDMPPATPDITKLCAVKPFVGPATARNSTNQTTTTKTLLFLGYMFSHEIELLEARLYEGMGVVDKHFIAESGYTHRGHRKRKIATELLATARFQRFADVVEIVDLDEHCPDTYLSSILRYRHMHPYRPQEIWDTQREAQNCLAAAIRAYAKRHDVPDALVHTSDLDEIPLRRTLVALKECQLSPQQQFPMPLATIRTAYGKLCQPPYPQVIPGLIFRAIDMTGQRRPEEDYYADSDELSQMGGGVHITYFGGSLVEFFKTSNHAEGGQMNTLGWLSNNGTHNPTVCEAVREDWYRREELLCIDTVTVIRIPPWLDKSPPRNEKAAVPVGDEYLPWVIAQNRERYPCFFDNHVACVDSYIDAIL